MKSSKDKQHGFYLNDFEELNSDIVKLQNQGERIFLIGVTYALIDFAINHKNTFNNTDVVMETGGMKGRKEELTRGEVHELLKKSI